MKHYLGYFGILCLLAGLLGSGCHTLGHQRMAVQVVEPGPQEQVIVDEFVVIMDASGSMALQGKWRAAKPLLQDFVRAMPEGDYAVAMTGFGGEWKMDWHSYPPQLFYRPSFAAAVDNLRVVFGGTYLAEAMADYESLGRRSLGHTAMLIISDGEVADPAFTRQMAQRLIDTHAGTLCIYTIHIGEDEAGGMLLHDLAAYSGCGRSMHVSSIYSGPVLESLVREIFLGQRIPMEHLSVPGLEGRSLLFDSGKSYIRPEYHVVIEDFARAMQAEPNLRVRIDGHTDSTGSAAANHAISLERAEAVKRALVERGISPGRIETRGLGDTQPLRPNTNAANRQLNRRVEFVPLR